MRLLLGISHMESGDYTSAIRSFERARAQMRPYSSQVLSVISLVSPPMVVPQSVEIACDLCQISGWKFKNLDITIRQRLCEALYAAGRIKEAGESLLDIVNIVKEEVYMTGLINTWVSGESCSTCLSVMHSKFLHRFCAAMSLHP